MRNAPSTSAKAMISAMKIDRKDMRASAEDLESAERIARGANKYRGAGLYLKGILARFTAGPPGCERR